MSRLALVLVFSSMVVGCVESTNGKEPPSVPSGMSQAIPSDPEPVVVHREAHMTVGRDQEPRTFIVHEHDVGECWQCRR